MLTSPRDPIIGLDCFYRNCDLCLIDTPTDQRRTDVIDTASEALRERTGNSGRNIPAFALDFAWNNRLVKADRRARALEPNPNRKRSRTNGSECGWKI